jgi:ABC-type sugar transport system substrate-binding protein
LIELILVRPDSLDRSYLELFLRRGTGANKCAIRVVTAKDNQPMGPEQIASEIRAAANRSTGVLMLDPVDVPVVREALHESESKGLGVVLLDSTLPAASPGKSYPFVTFDGFARAAKQLLETGVEDTKVMRLPADGTTMVLESQVNDHYSRDRLESLTSALKAVGRAYDLVSYDGEQSGATQVVLEYLKTHPKLTLLLADYDSGMLGANDARDQWRKTNNKLFAIAGYAACDSRLTEHIRGYFQGIIDRSIDAYAHKALQVAMDLMDGKPVAERNVADLRLFHNPFPFVPASSSGASLEVKVERAPKLYPRPLPSSGSGAEPNPK